MNQTKKRCVSCRVLNEEWDPGVFKQRTATGKALWNLRKQIIISLTTSFLGANTSSQEGNSAQYSMFEFEATDPSVQETQLYWLA